MYNIITLLGLIWNLLRSISFLLPFNIFWQFKPLWQLLINMPVDLIYLIINIYYQLFIDSSLNFIIVTWQKGQKKSTNQRSNKDLHAWYEHILRELFLAQPHAPYPIDFQPACPTWSQWSWLWWETQGLFYWQNWAGRWYEGVRQRSWWRRCPRQIWPPGRWRTWPWRRCVLPPSTPADTTGRRPCHKAETTSGPMAGPVRKKWP